jgi:hypothetical protein
MARRFRPLALTAALLCGLVLFASPANVVACSCAPVSRERMLPTVSDVFIGTVVAQYTVPPSPKPDEMVPFSPEFTVTYELDVSDTLKGKAKGRVRVVTGRDSAACGFPFVVGHRYLVFARLGFGVLRTSLCFSNVEGDGVDAAAAEVRTALAAKTKPAPKRH